MSAKSSNIVLVGMMGSGKTSIGSNLARTLGWDFLDFDEHIEKMTGENIPKIFATQGEEYFRDLETQVIREFRGTHTVIATGGGVMGRDENVEMLNKLGKTVYLKASAEALWARIQAQTHHRPLAKGNIEDFSALLKRREPMYERAQYTVETENKAIAQIVEEIYEKVNG